MRRLLAWAVTALCILSGAVAVLGPRHADPPAAIPWLAAPARVPRAPAPVAPAAPPDPAAPSPAPAAPTPRAPVRPAVRRAGVRQPARRSRRLPRIGARPLLRRTLIALASAPSFHGTLTERVSRALPAVERLMGAGGSLIAPGGRVLSIWHDRPDLWRIAARATARAPVTQLTVADGSTVTSWTRGGAVTRRPEAPGAGGPPDLGLGGLLAQLQHGAVLTVGGQARVDGRATYRLHALQRVRGLVADAVDLWIDGRTYLPLRIDATGPAGIPLVSARFTRIAFAGSPAARFRFVPPVSTKP